MKLRGVLTRVNDNRFCKVPKVGTRMIRVGMIRFSGTTFGIPDAVMGLTLLAIGGSMPEAISTYIMARQGEGGLGFSNSLGGNTMDICLCLGFPWLIMCIKEGSVGTFVGGCLPTGRKNATVR